MISIIVPIYKIEDLLPECVESLIQQTYKDIEIILVDDGSPDNCPKICDEYAKKDNRIRVLHKSNGGLVSARKAGLEIANGEYVSYVDGDDWVEPQMYEDFATVVAKYNVDIVAAGFKKDIGGATTEKINSLDVGYYDKKRLRNSIIPNMMFVDGVNQPGIYTYVWNKLFKKDLIFKNQMNVNNDIFLGEDAAVVYPTLLSSRSMYITDTCYYHYRQRADSMLKLSVGIEKDIKGIRLLYKYLYEKIFENGYIEIIENEFNKYIVYLLSSRTGGIIISDEANCYLYNHKFGNKLAIYGAGTFGQHFYRRINLINKYDVVKWVDPDYKILQKQGLKVDSPDTINANYFDNVVIAIMDNNHTNIIIQELESIGVNRSKIISTDFCSLDYNDILKKFQIK